MQSTELILDYTALEPELDTSSQGLLNDGGAGL